MPPLFFQCNCCIWYIANMFFTWQKKKGEKSKGVCKTTKMLLVQVIFLLFLTFLALCFSNLWMYLASSTCSSRGLFNINSVMSPSGIIAFCLHKEHSRVFFLPDACHCVSTQFSQKLCPHGRLRGILKANWTKQCMFINSYCQIFYLKLSK